MNPIQHLETLLREAGATILDPADLGAEVPTGFATLGNLILRYTPERIEIGWRPTFIRWSSSVAWLSAPPPTIRNLREIIVTAEKRGAAGEALLPAAARPGGRWLSHVPRSWAEHLGGTVLKFHHPCGHTSTKDFSEGPIPKRVGETGVAMYASWWSRAKGGVTAPCPRCERRVLDVGPPHAARPRPRRGRR